MQVEPNWLQKLLSGDVTWDGIFRLLSGIALIILGIVMSQIWVWILTMGLLRPR